MKMKNDTVNLTKNGVLAATVGRRLTPKLNLVTMNQPNRNLISPLFQNAALVLMVFRKVKQSIRGYTLELKIFEPTNRSLFRKVPNLR